MHIKCDAMASSTMGSLNGSKEEEEKSQKTAQFIDFIQIASVRGIK